MMTMGEQVFGVETDQIRLVHQRMHEAQSEMRAFMKRSMYGDTEACVPPTRWQRYVQYWRGLPARARDAWAVLMGDAEIGY